MYHLIHWLLFSLVITLFSCSSADTERRLESLPVASSQTPLSVIALGSCNSQDREQPLWREILKNQPQLWVWLGDNIYGDTDDMQVLRAKYEKQLQNEGYQKLVETVPVIGVWDDHDYGRNNAGKEYKHKGQSAQLFWDFMGEPLQSLRRKQKGVYSAHTFGPAGKQVKVILLDVRSQRDSLRGKEPNYQPNLKGDILGETQWRWLEKELQTSKAQFHLIGSGLQIIANDHGFERWGNFPKSRQRLFNLIAKTKAANVILLSGDRHFAELSKITWPGVPYPIYDFTTSGLTHYWKGGLVNEPNQHRVGEMHDKLNFAVMRFHWDQTPAVVDFEIRGRDNELHQLIKVEYALPQTSKAEPIGKAAAPSKLRQAKVLPQ
ncbi:alkaline phosphatase D family protein [Rufibacter latericius]|uniref:Alkaline phosphatase family protein n=1 Tax=Rufibacter latericius TaxID=2487040 RepID=A0A3M9MQA9_9BACT|nr:alkaline phosphatase D family protein [Rufibacter latericius]RNI26888.1 alkaline phosphatase family protein [Rufibacter latericius]